MLEVEYRQRFEKLFWELPDAERDLISDTIKELFDTIEKQKTPRKGLGLKKFFGDYWEIRTELGIRILFERIGSKISFAIFGSHDDLRNFIKNQ